MLVVCTRRRDGSGQSCNDAHCPGKKFVLASQDRPHIRRVVGPQPSRSLDIREQKHPHRHATSNPPLTCPDPRPSRPDRFSGPIATAVVRPGGAGSTPSQNPETNCPRTLTPTAGSGKRYGAGPWTDLRRAPPTTAAPECPAMDLAIRVDDPRAEDVRELLAIHLGFSRGVTPIEYSFALDVDQLADSSITFFSARRAGELMGIAALKRLDEIHGELKSMHTREAERGRGVGRALVEHILGYARGAGYRRVSLETGATEEFVAARTLYANVGFEAFAAFADYQPSPYNTFMTMNLESASGYTSA